MNAQEQNWNPYLTTLCLSVGLPAMTPEDAATLLEGAASEADVNQTFFRWFTEYQKALQAEQDRRLPAAEAIQAAMERENAVVQAQQDKLLQEAAQAFADHIDKTKKAVALQKTYKTRDGRSGEEWVKVLKEVQRETCFDFVRMEIQNERMVFFFCTRAGTLVQSPIHKRSVDLGQWMVRVTPNFSTCETSLYKNNWIAGGLGHPHFRCNEGAEGESYSHPCTGAASGPMLRCAEKGDFVGAMRHLNCIYTRPNETGGYAIWLERLCDTNEVKKIEHTWK